MSGVARFSPQAQREIAAALAGIEHRATAARLRTALAAAAGHIGQHPAIGRHRPDLADARYRFWALPGFAYLLVYRPATVPPSIVRFVHGERDLAPLLADLATPDG